jgi:hypothetical protein
MAKPEEASLGCERQKGPVHGTGGLLRDSGHHAGGRALTTWEATMPRSDSTDRMAAMRPSTSANHSP